MCMQLYVPMDMYIIYLLFPLPPSISLPLSLTPTHSLLLPTLSPQLVIFWSAQEYILAEHLLHWLQEFNITVTTIEKIFPSTKPRLDRFYAQVLSFAKAYESTILKVHVYMCV